MLDELGRSDFHRLQERAKRRRWYEGCDPVVFCAFDLLALDGRSLIGLPVEGRKAQLLQLLTPQPSSVLFVGHFDAEHGRQLFDHAKELKLEGLVAKRLGPPYLPGERTRQRSDPPAGRRDQDALRRAFPLPTISHVKS